MTAVIDRMATKYQVNNETGCWDWTASKSHFGYGRIRLTENGRSVVRYAHRVMYELIKGHVAAGLDLDHLCRNPSCINPAHLEPVTRQVNVIRGINPQLSRDRKLSRTTCQHGHPYTPENTYIHPDLGFRKCRTCGREQHRESDARRRAAK